MNHQRLNKTNLAPTVRRLTTDYQLGGGGDIRNYPKLNGANSSTMTGLGVMMTETKGPMSKGIVRR